MSARDRAFISWIGLSLILTAIVVLDPGYAFPGAWALLPTMGTACMIFAGDDAWLNRQVLSLRLLVWIGLISYPLYLWHWPLLSFARIMESRTPALEVRFWLVAASIVLAWLTYRLLERPIRSRSRSPGIVVMLFLTMILLGAAGLVVYKMDGLKSRQFSMLNGETATIVLGSDRAKLQHECGLEEAQKPLFQFCLRSGAEEPRYALLGDSKGEALFYGLARESKPDSQWMMIGTVYPPEVDAAPKDRQQVRNRLALQTIIHNPTIRVVAMAVALRSIFPINNVTGFIESDVAPPPGKIAIYSQVIQQLEQAGKRVVFVMDNPTFPDPTSCISGGATSSTFLNRFLRRKENPHCTIRYTDHLAGTQAYRQFVAELKRLHPGLIVYDPVPLLCDIPRDVCTITQEGKFLYSYSDHVSDYANSMIARDLLPVIWKLAP